MEKWQIFLENKKLPIFMKLGKIEQTRKICWEGSSNFPSGQYQYFTTYQGRIFMELDKIGKRINFATCVLSL